jgi:hypothetical protein
MEAQTKENSKLGSKKKFFIKGETLDKGIEQLLLFLLLNSPDSIENISFSVLLNSATL